MAGSWHPYYTLVVPVLVSDMNTVWWWAEGDSSKKRSKGTVLGACVGALCCFTHLPAEATSHTLVKRHSRPRLTQGKTNSQPQPIAAFHVEERAKYTSTDLTLKREAGGRKGLSGRSLGRQRPLPRLNAEPRSLPRV